MLLHPLRHQQRKCNCLTCMSIQFCFHLSSFSIHLLHSHAKSMPHFPEVSNAASEIMSLPTRERDQEHQEPNNQHQRPHPPTQNDTERASRLRTQTRRRRYLVLNPSYFDGSNLEQAGRSTSIFPFPSISSRPSACLHKRSSSQSMP
jgi:hypothetical protein